LGLHWVQSQLIDPRFAQPTRPVAVSNVAKDGRDPEYRSVHAVASGHG
jgi:hypothetical protein